MTYTMHTLFFSHNCSWLFVYIIDLVLVVFSDVASPLPRPHLLCVSSPCSSATSAAEDTVEKKCCRHQSDLRPAAALCLLMSRRVRHGAQLPPLVRIRPEQRGLRAFDLMLIHRQMRLRVIQWLSMISAFHNCVTIYTMIRHRNRVVLNKQ